MFITSISSQEFQALSLFPKTEKRKSNAGWREIDGEKYYFRSKWENNYARLLNFLYKNGDILAWEYEPKTFWFETIKRGVRSYLPDFRVTEKSGRQIYIEVKGYLSPKDKTKIKRFKKYYPTEELYLIDAAWFKCNNPRLRGLVKGWE